MQHSSAAARAPDCLCFSQRLAVRVELHQPRVRALTRQGHWYPTEQDCCQRTARSLRTAASADETLQADSDLRQQYIRVKLRKPMGMVLSEKNDNVVFVEEITTGGNADKSGKVEVGDIISKCSAYVLKSGKDGDYEREGYGKRPYTNWEPIMFDCTGQDFKTVMSAISSNNDRWGIFDVTLELKRERSN